MTNKDELQIRFILHHTCTIAITSASNSKVEDSMIASQMLDVKMAGIHAFHFCVGLLKSIISTIYIYIYISYTYISSRLYMGLDVLPPTSTSSHSTKLPPSHSIQQVSA